MPERLSDRLDRTIDLLLEHGDATAALMDRELAPLARVAAELRDYPAAEFKARLRSDLQRRTTMSSAVAAPHIREGFTTVTPYIHLRNAGLVDFLTRVFDAKETFSVLGGGGGMHREVRLGDSMLMIGEGGGDEVMPFRPAAFHVYVPDVDSTYERAIAAGAVSLGAPEVRHYGERAGFVRDEFGNNWYIATHLGDSYVPQGLRAVTPFLHLRDAARHIEFLKQAFSAEEVRREGAGEAVRYARLNIGNGALELGEAQPPVEPMSAVLYLYVRDPDVVYQQAIAAGAKSLWAPKEQAYGERMGAVEDPWRNQWFIARPGSGA